MIISRSFPLLEKVQVLDHGCAVGLSVIMEMMCTCAQQNRSKDHMWLRKCAQCKGGTEISNVSNFYSFKFK
jgi:hypothetical protein